MKKRIPKRKTFVVLGILILLVTSAFSYYYSHFIAPDAYQFTYKTISTKTLSTTVKDLNIAFISDINLKDQKDIDRFRAIVKDINEQEYDMVIFGGDLYDEAPFNTVEVMNILKDIRCDYGKFAIQGEKDLVYNNDTINVLSEGGFEVLHNEYRKIHYRDATFALFGLEKNGDISGLINNENQDMYKLVIVHEPDYFTQTKKENIDLQLSGHSLGGYIDLPIYGPIFKKDDAQNYSNGTYEEGSSKLIVSNGLGLEAGHTYRLFCPNEIVSISLNGTKTK